MAQNPAQPAAPTLGSLEMLDAKLAAETEAAFALAEFHRANAALAAATARKNDAEAEAFQAEVDGRRAQTQVARITADMAQRETDRVYASDSENNIYRFVGAVADDSVNKCMKTLSAWSRLNPGEDLELQFYSPGGSVVSGLALWDFLQELKTRDDGHKITTVINGYAASMAGILAQVGDVRVIGKESWLMIHEVSFGAQGKIGEVEDTVDWIKMVQERVVRIFAERSDLSPEEIRDMQRRKDCWLSSDQALARGLVDEVRG